jgi:hypothetical protein
LQIKQQVNWIGTLIPFPQPSASGGLGGSSGRIAARQCRRDSEPACRAGPPPFFFYVRRFAAVRILDIRAADSSASAGSVPP